MAALPSISPRLQVFDSWELESFLPLVSAMHKPLRRHRRGLHSTVQTPQVFRWRARRCAIRRRSSARQLWHFAHRAVRAHVASILAEASVAF